MPDVAAGRRRAAGDRDDVAAVQVADLRGRRRRALAHRQAVGQDAPEAAARELRRREPLRGRGPCAGVPARIAGTHAERVAVAVQRRVDRRTARRLRQPRVPAAAVDRDLHVVAGNAARVGPGPRDLERGVGLHRSDVPDPDLRRLHVRRELVADRLPELGPRPVVAQRPDAGAAQVVAVDEVVLGPQRLGVVDVELAPRGDAAVGRGAVLAPIRRPGHAFCRVVVPPVVREIVDRRAVDDRGRGAVFVPLMFVAWKASLFVDHARP